MARVTNTEVKTPTNKPKVKVKAKPLTGPVPNWNNQIEAIQVVKLESKIALHAFS